MVTTDIKSVQLILQKNITFGHTKRLLKKMRIVWDSYSYSIKMWVFFTLTYLRNTLRIN